MMMSELRDIYRPTSKRDSSRPIVVDFCSVVKKEDFLSAVKSFNKDKDRDHKLNTTLLKTNTEQKPVYVSEYLTYKQRRIFYQARLFATDNGFAFCWTSRGVTYLKKKEGAPFIRVNNETDLPKIKTKA